MTLLWLLLPVAAFVGGFVLGRSALVYRRRWKDAVALIEKLSADDAERKRQWELERRTRYSKVPMKPLTPNQQALLERLRKQKGRAA